MPVSVRDVYEAIHAFAPFDLAEEWDNIGILAGSADQQVNGVLCALDLNPMVIDEAIEKGANLIVTHHPILFRGRKNLREDDPEGRMLAKLIRANIALIAAHTNFDNAVPGVNDALAAKLNLCDVQPLENGMRIGTTGHKTLAEFTAFASEVLGAPVRCYGEGERKISRVAVLGGAGEDFCAQALSAGADVYLTGEAAHHKAWDAYLSGLCVLEAGHAATELPAIHLLREGLQKAADGVQWNVRIFESEFALFR